MIRFIRIGNQINEDDDAFAFYDTVVDKFVDVDGEHVFTSIQDLAMGLRFSQYTDEQRQRLLRHALTAHPPVRNNE